MASSLTDTMPLPTTPMSHPRLEKSATLTMSGELFRPLQSAAVTAKPETVSGNDARSKLDTYRRLQPARKKLTTLEAQVWLWLVGIL